MNTELFADIVAKVLKGDATPHEKRMLSNYLKEVPEMEELFYHQLSEYEMQNPQYLPKADTKVQEFEKYMLGAVPRSVFVPDQNTDDMPARQTSNTLKWWLAAASFTLFLSVSFYFLGDLILYNTYTAANGMIRSVVLEDGSTVTLNANSSIKVLRDFVSHQHREVWIDGEAFFEVTRRSDVKKFIVHTDNFDVEVLGTKFNVNNRSCKSEVMLAEGKVKLVAKDQQPLIMKPGEQVTLTRSQASFEKAVVEPEKYAAWRNNMLVFENRPLSEVSQIIQDYYGVEMIVTDSLLGAREFTGTLPNHDLDVILLALSTAYNLQIERNGDQIRLYKKDN